MTTYTVQRDHVGLEPWPMIIGQVDHIVFSNNVGRVRILTDGLAEFRVTNDGTTPAFTTGGTSTTSYRIPAGTNHLELDVPTVNSGNGMIRILSGAVSKVSVQVVR